MEAREAIQRSSMEEMRRLVSSLGRNLQRNAKDFNSFAVPTTSAAAPPSTGTRGKTVSNEQSLAQEFRGNGEASTDGGLQSTEGNSFFSRRPWQTGDGSRRDDRSPSVKRQRENEGGTWSTVVSTRSQRQKPKTTTGTANFDDVKGGLNLLFPAHA